MANFPAGPINGQTTTINGIVYIYDDVKTAWKRSTSFGGNLTILGNITSANVVTGNVYTSGGIYWSGNGAAYSSGGGTGSSNFLYTAAASAPGSPTKGDQWFDTTDGTLYEYIDDGDSFQWIDIQSPTFASNAVATSLTGNVTTNGNISGSSIIITSGIFWANGTTFATSVYSNVNVEAYIGGNLGSYQIYANTNAASQSSSINTTNANLGAYQTYANTKIGTNTNSNLVVVATTPATNITSGALVVLGGVGIAGNIYANGNVFLGAGITSNLVANATTTSTSTTTGALVVRGGAGIAGNVTSANVVTGNVFMSSGVYWSNNGAAYSSGGSPFASNIVITSGTASTDLTSGALVITGSGGLGVGGRINAGGLLTVTSGGSDITGDSYYRGGYLQVLGGATSTSTSSGALTVLNSGGLGVTGNVYVGDEFVVPGGGKITSTGLAYLLEKANVVAAAPGTTVNVDMATVSVMYWTGNATGNVTANIRGTATQPLNSLMAIGQSVTAVLFFPNGPSNYLVNTIKIDNTTVTPAYLGNAAPVLGNSNSIDIYSFTILKTASATYKIFASQTQFMHPG